MTSTFDSLTEFEDLNLEDETRDDIFVAKRPLRRNRVDINEVKILSNWNFKGGVGKTTTTFALAFSLAHTFKKKVLMVDADPQKNLTQLVARFYLNRHSESEARRSLIEGILNEKNRGFYFAMNQAMENRQIEAAEIIQIPIEDVGSKRDQLFKNPGKESPKYLTDMLFLLSGSYQTAMIESWLHEGYNVNFSQPTAAQIAPFPCVFWNLVRQTAADYGCEYVIVDLSPAISLLNTNILFSSDAFILPSLPEWFSIEALRSIPKLLTDGKYWERYQSWKQKYSEWVQTREKISYYRFPRLDHYVQFAGMIVTRYNYNEGFEGNYAPHSQVLRSYFQQLRIAATVLATNSHSSSSANAIPPENESLPSEMLRIITELGWNQDNPFEEENFRLLLTRLPELHKLNLIAQNASIPSPYLPYRLLQNNRGLDPSSRQKLWFHRKAIETVARSILENFFDESVDLSDDEEYPENKKKRRSRLANTSRDEEEEEEGEVMVEDAAVLVARGIMTEAADEVESLQSYHEEEEEEQGEEAGDLSNALVVQDNRVTKKPRS